MNHSSLTQPHLLTTVVSPLRTQSLFFNRDIIYTQEKYRYFFYSCKFGNYIYLLNYYPCDRKQFLQHKKFPWVPFATILQAHCHLQSPNFKRNCTISILLCLAFVHHNNGAYLQDALKIKLGNICISVILNVQHVFFI